MWPPVQLALVLVTVFALPGSALAHAGGILNLNECIQISNVDDRRVAHFDAFQNNRGPYCDWIPELGKASLVFDLREDLKKTPLAVRIYRPGPNGDRVTEPMTEVATDVFHSGVVTTDIVFEKPGVYEARVELANAPDALVFPVWVVDKPPLERRLKTLFLEAAERPYAVLFVLFVGIVLGAFAYTRAGGKSDR